MNEYDIAIAIVLTLIIMFITVIIKELIKEKKMAKRNKEVTTDYNIEFGGEHGITQVKKQYPELEIEDDWRTGIVEKGKHGDKSEKNK